MTNPSATHTGLFYDSDAHYSREVGSFLRDGLERGHRTLVMAPPRQVDLARAALGRLGERLDGACTAGRG